MENVESRGDFYISSNLDTVKLQTINAVVPNIHCLDTFSAIQCTIRQFYNEENIRLIILTKKQSKTTADSKKH